MQKVTPFPTQSTKSGTITRTGGNSSKFRSFRMMNRFRRWTWSCPIGVNNNPWWIHTVELTRWTENFQRSFLGEQAKFHRGALSVFSSEDSSATIWDGCLFFTEEWEFTHRGGVTDSGNFGIQPRVLKYLPRLTLWIIHEQFFPSRIMGKFE